MVQEDLSIIIDDKILKEFVYHNRKLIAFLIFWLDQHNTRVVTTKEVLDEFEDKWDLRLGEGDIKLGFFGFINSHVRRYKKEDLPKGNIVEQIIEMVNRDYDVVKYVIVDNPSDYHSDAVKIDNKRIVDLHGFYTQMEINNPQLVESFLNQFGS